jgi:hypothetical protein
MQMRAGSDAGNGCGHAATAKQWSRPARGSPDIHGNTDQQPVKSPDPARSSSGIVWSLRHRKRRMKEAGESRANVGYLGRAALI